MRDPFIPRPIVTVHLASNSVDQPPAEVPRVDAHAVKLWVLIGRCDGWMRLMESRDAPADQDQEKIALRFPS